MSGNSNQEESEDAINQALEDLEMLEDGMTLDDKRNLWAVIKISQDTAEAEEQDRLKRAKQNLQFDQVSSRAESSPEPVASPDDLIEEVICPSAQQIEDNEAEEEKKPTVSTLLPQQRTTPLRSVTLSKRTTATVLPLLHSHEGEASQNQNNVNLSCAPVSSSSQSPTVSVSWQQQDDSSRDGSIELSQSSSQRLTRSLGRCLRPRPNVLTTETRKLSPRNNSSCSVTQNLSFSRTSDKGRHDLQMVPETTCVTESLKPETPLMDSVMTSRDTPKVIRSSRKSEEGCRQDSTSSSPLPIVESSRPSDKDDSESPVSNIRKSVNSLSMSNFQRSDAKERTSDKTEGNEGCCKENNCSALEERTRVSLFSLFSEEQSENEEKTETLGRTIDNVPSPKAASMTNCNSSWDIEKKGSEDRERNINVFNCDRSNYHQTLKVRKEKAVYSRSPFYIPPCKMDIHTYITYFKKCINEQAAHLIEVQRKNHKYVPWGEPVVVGESNSRELVTTEQGEQKNKSLANLRKYNFQHRKVTYQKVDTIYEDTDVQSDDDMFFDDSNRGKVVAESQEDTTDELFDSLLKLDKSMDKKEDKGPVHNVAGNTRTNSPAVDRQVPMKRKSESSDDQMFDQEEKSSEPREKRVAPSQWLTANKKEAVAVKRKKLFPCVMSARREEDLDEDFEPSVKLSRQCGGAKSSKKRMVLRNSASKKKQSADKDGDTDDEISIFDDLDIAEGVGGNSSSHQKIEIIRPGPLKLKRQGRQLIQQTKAEAEHNEEVEQKESDAAAVDDVTVVYEAGSSGVREMEAQLFPCPICRKAFPAEDIQVHASGCDEYCEEEIPPDDLHISSASSSPEMVAAQSSQSVISERCWSEFESGKGFESDRNPTRQTRRRPETRQGTAASKNTSA